MIKIENLNKIFNENTKKEFIALKDINLEIKTSSCVVLKGISGSGKSTLLNIISSLLKPSNGSVVFKSKDIYSLKQNELLKIRRDDFGIIFQAHYLFRGFSADENLQIATLLSGEEVDSNLLKDLKIEHVIKQAVGELSGGQQQRLSIARIMTKKPRIIFADEPTGNLDKDTANIVMETLFSYIKQNDAGLILVTHENELAMKCDKVYKLEDLKLQELK